MKDIQNQLMAYGELPLNIANGTDRGDWEGRISPVPGSDLAKLWDDPTGYPVGLLELTTDALEVIFAGGRELSHVYDGPFGRTIDDVRMNIVRDRRLGQRVMFDCTRQFGNIGHRRYLLNDTELRVFEGSQPGDDDSMLFRPFFDKDGNVQWQLMWRVVKVIHRHVPVAETIPAYLNYLFKNLERAIGEGLKTDADGELVDVADDWNIEEVQEEFTAAALQHHPLGVYNFIPTDRDLIGWFLSVKANIAAGGLDHTVHGLETVLELTKRIGEQFAELTEPFVQQAIRNNPILAREIAKQDEEGSPDDEDEDEI